MWVAGILVVLAVVTEEILREGAVEDVTDLQIGFDVDTKPLEFIGLVWACWSAHSARAADRLGGPFRLSGGARDRAFRFEPAAGLVPIALSINGDYWFIPADDPA
jgi:hypothetical protein